MTVKQQYMELWLGHKQGVGGWGGEWALWTIFVKKEQRLQGAC